MTKIAITYSAEVGGTSVFSLKKSFLGIGCEVVDADYREMMRDIPQEEFEEAYKIFWGRSRLFAHAKYAAESFLNGVDCLVLSGNSAMIDPDLFNQERTEGQSYDFSRTLAELALVHVATQRGMPIMGVCGGHQVVSVYGGGTIRDSKSTELNKQSFMNYDVIHFSNNSLIKQIIESSPMSDTSLELEFFGAHNQAVDQLRKGFIKTAMSSDRKVIEAAESVYGAPVITTQFHPEVTVHGLPNFEHLYRKDETAIESSLKIFSFFDKAGEVYQNKKNLNYEIKDKVKKIDLSSIQDPKIKENIVSKLRRLKKQGVNKNSKKRTSTVKFYAKFGNFIDKLIENIKSFFRKCISDNLTLQKVEVLKKREQRIGSLEEPLTKLSQSTEKISVLENSQEYQSPKRENEANIGFSESFEKEKRNPMQVMINEPTKKWVKRGKFSEDKLPTSSAPMNPLTLSNF